MATKVPAYSYSGTHASEVKNGYWYIYLKSGGDLKMTYAKNAEVCIVGGGAAGSTNNGGGGAYDSSGGGGGTVLNLTGVTIAAGTSYGVTIGAGGQTVSNYGPGGSGGASSAFNRSAAGGVCRAGNAGLTIGAAGGNGTHAFNDSSLPRYGAGGGAGGASGTDGGADGGKGGADGGGNGGHGAYFHSPVAAAAAGAANTGAGGGGQGAHLRWGDDSFAAGGLPANGGSGIVIIRGTQDDKLPVFFDGTQLTEMFFNGEKLSGLIYGGTRIFAQAFARWKALFRGRLHALRVQPHLARA